MILALSFAACGPVNPADTDPSRDTDTAADTDTTGDTDTDTAADTDTTPPVPGLPEDAAYWEGDDPLGPLVRPDPVPTIPHWEVRLATRADASAAWEPDPRVIAVALSSISVHVLPSGAGERLVITGNVDHEQARGLGVEPILGTVFAVTTTDLETWHGIAWPVAEATHGFVIDPALYTGLDGSVGATWYATSEQGGDPATFPGDHELRTGHWWDGALIEDAGAPAYAGPLLADPVICPLADTSWLFATLDASDVLLARAGEDGVYTLFEDSLWQGPSVPSCRVVDDRIELVVQHAGGYEPPAVGRLDADGTFTKGDALYDEHPWGDDCTSPAIAAWSGREVLVCAVFEG